MKLGRTCAAAAVLGTLALPMTAAVSWADTAPDQQPDESARPAPQEPGATRAPGASQKREPTRASETRPAPEPEQRRGQVEQRPSGAPDTGGGPAGWDATPAYVTGGAAAVAVAGVGTVLVLRRRHAGQR